MKNDPKYTELLKCFLSFKLMTRILGLRSRFHLLIQEWKSDYDKFFLDTRDAAQDTVKRFFFSSFLTNMGRIKRNVLNKIAPDQIQSRGKKTLRGLLF